MAVGGSGEARQQHAILFGEQSEVERGREDSKQDGREPQRERGRLAEGLAGKQEGGGGAGRKASVTE